MGKTALEGKRGTLFNLPPTALTIITDPKHALYDERVRLPLDSAFIANIAYYGVLEPVLVCKEGEAVVVVAGRRRVRAAIEANKMLAERGKVELFVPCILRYGDEIDLFGIAVSENEQRTPDSPFVRARKAQRLLAMVGSLETVAVAFGVGEKTVEQWLSLLGLAPEVRAAIERCELSSTAALSLVSKSTEEQVTLLAGLKQTPFLAAPFDKRQKPLSARRVAAAAGKAVLKMKSRREIIKRLDEDKLPRDYRAALTWVLGTVEE